MIEQYAQSLAHFLQANPSWGGLLAFFIAFVESLAVIGTVIPGSVTMTAIGMLIGASMIPFGQTLLWATVGAFFGDLLSYWLGRHYNERLRNMWPFKNHPQWLEAGETFFHKHGGKSILIGRFMGPIRSIIPLIAGLLHMSWQRFVLAGVPAAFLWAIAYMLPGILIGALSLQLPPSLATKFILILLAIIIALTLLGWLINIFSGKLKKSTGIFLKKTWGQLQSQKKYDWFTALIASKNQPDNYQQLGWFIAAVLAFIIFLVIGFGVYEQNWLTNLNRPIFEFLRSIRNIKTDRIMIGATLLGDGRVLISSAIIMIIWLFWHKRQRAAYHWLLTIGIAIVIPNLLKYIFYVQRPMGLIHASSTSSFPSGHTFLGVMFYGFLATFIATHIQTRFKRYGYYSAATLSFFVGFSRLYLGAHWLTDVLASVFLASSFLAIVTLMYRKQENITINIKQFLFLALSLTFIIWLLYFILYYEKNTNRYRLSWPSQGIAEEAWWGRPNPALPSYRENRIGEPIEPMNIQYSGDAQQLKKILIAEGWSTTPSMTLFKNTLDKLAQNQTTLIPLLPSLYLNKPPLLFLIKSNNKRKFILKLWKSNVYLLGSKDWLCVGNITEYQITSKKKIIYSFNTMVKLLPYLNINDWRITVINAEKIPYPLLKQKWDGKILQISAPTLY